MWDPVMMASLESAYQRHSTQMGGGESANAGRQHGALIYGHRGGTGFEPIVIGRDPRRLGEIVRDRPVWVTTCLSTPVHGRFRSTAQSGQTRRNVGSGLGARSGATLHRLSSGRIVRDRERTAFWSISPAIRNGSLVSPDADCTGTEPATVTLYGRRSRARRDQRELSLGVEVRMLR